jgi:hypothetical protein
MSKIRKRHQRRYQLFRKIEIVVILIVAAVVGYRAYLAIPDRVGWDFVNFSNKVLTPTLALMPETTRYLAAKTDAEKADAYALDFAPVYAEKIQRLQAAHPKTQEVQRLRRMYVDSFQATLQSYLDYSVAVQTKDPAKFTSSAREKDAGAAKFNEARNYGLALIKAHHVQIDAKQRK